MLWNKLYIMLLILGFTILAETFVFHSIGKTYTHKHTHTHVSLCRWLDRPVSLVPARSLGYRDKTVAGGHGSSCVRMCVCVQESWGDCHFTLDGLASLSFLWFSTRFCLVWTSSLSVDKMSLNKNKSVLFFLKLSSSDHAGEEAQLFCPSLSSGLMWSRTPLFRVWCEL